MSKQEITWEFQDKKFKVGESLNEHPWEENNIFPIVWFKKRLYRATIKPCGKVSRVCLQDIYDPNKKPYWTTADKVFNIIELCQKEK